MIQFSTDEILRRIEVAFPAVAQAAIEKARQTKTKLVVWKDGKVIEIDPDEVGASASETPAAEVKL
jgi:hypothetical protein